MKYRSPIHILFLVSIGAWLGACNVVDKPIGELPGSTGGQ